MYQFIRTLYKFTSGTLKHFSQSAFTSPLLQPVCPSPPQSKIKILIPVRSHQITT